MNKYLYILILFPFTLFAQSATIESIYPVIKHKHSQDSIKSIAYPYIKCASSSKINNTIKTFVFSNKEYDTARSLQKLLIDLYKTDKGFNLNYTVMRNKNGLLSITINLSHSIGKRKPPIYLNFDLSTGTLVTISNMLQTKNDSFSFRQAVVPIVTDSIRLFEQTIDKNNPKYSEIIEWLNNALADFRHNYPSQYLLTDRGLIVYFDCFIPNNLLVYNHTYRLTFTYKTFRNIFKPEFVKRLQ